MKAIFKLFVIFLMLSNNLWAANEPSPWYTLSADKKAALNVSLFLSSTCPHCQKADEFFKQLAVKAPYLTIQRNLINEDKDALLRFSQLLSEQHADDYAVPSVYFCNSRWVGFASAETTGKDLEKALNYCKQQIEKNGTLTPATINTLKQWANANKFDSGMVENPSDFRYIVTMAITDAFAPCSFFALAGFFAFFFIEKERKKLIIGCSLFIIAMVLMHYFQQTYANAFYHLLPWLRIPAALLGVATLYFLVQFYKKQSSTTWYYALAFLMGLMIMAYQQTCAMNWAYIFEQWVNNQNLSLLYSGFYRVLYQALYAFPLLIMLIVLLSLLKIKRFAASHSKWTSTGLLFLLVIALSLIIYPALLAQVGYSIATLIVLVICGRFIKLT